jgi:glutathione S-transferase
MIWIAGRIAFAKGYYTGNPEKRMQGAFGYIGLLTLLGTTVKLGVHLIRRS